MESPLVPYFPTNISYVPKDKSYTDFRASILGRSDWSISLRAGQVYKTVSSYFESIGDTTYNVVQHAKYECPSNIEKTIVLYDTPSYFSGKLTYLFASDGKGKLVFRPVTWFPETDSVHALTITVTPGDYRYVWLIHPLRFQPEIQIPRGLLPQPPRGFFTHTISYTLTRHIPE